MHRHNLVALAMSIVEFVGVMCGLQAPNLPTEARRYLETERTQAECSTEIATRKDSYRVENPQVFHWGLPFALLRSGSGVFDEHPLSNARKTTSLQN